MCDKAEQINEAQSMCYRQRKCTFPLVVCRCAFCARKPSSARGQFPSPPERDGVDSPEVGPTAEDGDTIRSRLVTTRWSVGITRNAEIRRTTPGGPLFLGLPRQVTG